MKKKIYLCLFMTVCVFSVQAQRQTLVSSHKLTEQSSRVYLRDVLEKYAEQTGAKLIYNDNLVDGKLVGAEYLHRLNTGKLNINQVLDLFRLTLHKVKNYYILKRKVISHADNRPQLHIERKQIDLKAMELRPKKIFQEVVASGQVIDELGDPLPGVNILIKGTLKGTVTDINGNFKLAAGKGNTLIFSFLGYKPQEIVFANQTNLRVSLQPDVAQLDEVVVVGYGTRKKGDVSGSVGVVTSQELQEVPVTSIDQTLQGRVAGVQITQASAAPGGAVSVRIRGNTSFNSNEPLYVIDGIPIYNDNNSSSSLGSISGGGQKLNVLASLNPSDIESITVLKDAAASIYGSRAANGVVLITTKSGKAGKMKVGYDAYFGTQQVIKKIDLLDSYEFVELYNEARTNDGRGIYTGDDTKPYNVPNFRFPENEFLSQLSGTTNWQDEVLRNAFTQNHNLNIRGGKKDFLYSTSLSYFNQDGIVRSSGFERVSAKLNLSKTFAKRLTVTGNVSYANITTQVIPSDGNAGSTGAIIGPTLVFLPFVPVTNELGLFNKKHPAAFSDLSNPLIGVELNSNENKSSRFIGAAAIDYKIMEGLHLKSNYSWNKIDDNTLLENVAYQEWVGPDAFNSALAFAESEEDTWVYEANLNYDKKFGDVTVSALMGLSYQKTRLVQNFTQYNGFADFPLDSLLASALGFSPTNEQEYGLQSYYGRLSLDYKGKYYLEGIMRTDGSSRFGSDQRWGIFPSVLASWRIKDEGFLKNVDPLSDLKIRASIGVLGNQEIGNYAWQGGYAQIDGIYSFNGVRVLGTFPESIPNNALKWEETTTYNIGIDLAFLGNRIQITADSYIKNTSDVLYRVALEAHSGFDVEPFQNIADVRNSGYEFVLSTINVSKENFSWSTDLNFSQNRNELLSFKGFEDQPPILENPANGRGGLTILQVGQPIGSFYGWKTDGVFVNQQEVDAHVKDGSPIQPNAQPGDIRYVDINDDGVIDGADRTIIGNGNPDFLFGFNNRFTYKNFELSLFFQGQKGNEVYNDNRRMLESLNGTQNQMSSVNDRWVSEAQPGNGSIPRATTFDPNFNNRIYSDRWLDDGSFIRLRNVSLSYNFGKEVLDKIKLSSLRVYFTGQNLLTISDYTGFDPEVSSNGQDALFPGYDIGGYPRAKSYLFGLNVGF